MLRTMNRHLGVVILALTMLALSIPSWWSAARMEQFTGLSGHLASVYALGGLGGVLMASGASGMMGQSPLPLRPVVINLIGFVLVLLAIVLHGQV